MLGSVGSCIGLVGARPVSPILDTALGFHSFIPTFKSFPLPWFLFPALSAGNVLLYITRPPSTNIMACHRPDSSRIRTLISFHATPTSPAGGRWDGRSIPLMLRFSHPLHTPPRARNIPPCLLNVLSTFPPPFLSHVS